MQLNILSVSLYMYTLSICREMPMAYTISQLKLYGSNINDLFARARVIMRPDWRPARSVSLVPKISGTSDHMTLKHFGITSVALGAKASYQRYSSK